MAQPPMKDEELEEDSLNNLISSTKKQCVVPSFSFFSYEVLNCEGWVFLVTVFIRGLFPNIDV